MKIVFSVIWSLIAVSILVASQGIQEGQNASSSVLRDGQYSARDALIRESANADYQRTLEEDRQMLNRHLLEAQSRVQQRQAEQNRFLTELAESRGYFAKVTGQVKAAEGRANALLKKLMSAQDKAERNAVEAEIRRAMTEAYQTRLDAYQKRISMIQNKVQQMEEQLESHQVAMDDLIELQLQWMKRNAELGDLAIPSGPGAIFGDGPAPPGAPVAPLFPSGIGPHSEPGDLIPPPASPEVPPAFPDFGEAHKADMKKEAVESASKIFFASERTLENGKITITGISNPGSRSKITFGGQRDSIGVSLQPGSYSYRYEQDGEVWGEGKFEKLKGKRQVIEIETGEYTTHMLEHHKVAVKFKTDDQGVKGNLFVQGIDLEYSANEFTGEFLGELEYKYLPGRYIMVFSSDTAKKIQTFQVMPGEPMTVNMDGKKRSKATD